MRMHNRNRTPAPASGSRAGFTLVEVLVAMMLMTVGLLGLGATAGVVARQIGGGTQMVIASTAAQARFEQLRAQDCTSLSAGTAVTRGVTEVWTVTPGTRTVVVTDTVKYTTQRGQRSQAYRTMIPCPALP